MFTQKDLRNIDRSYFRVISAGCFGVTLQSKNTSHCWHIASEDFGNYKSCKIYHTHHEGTAYHEHGHGRMLGSCMEQIRSHDRYQLAKDYRKRQHHKHIAKAGSLITNF